MLDISANLPIFLSTNTISRRMSFLPRWKWPFNLFPHVARREVAVRPLSGLHRWAFSWMPRSGIAVEIGLSSSTFSSAIACKAVRTVAVVGDDGSPQRRKNDPALVSLIRASAAKLPFPSGSVDAVFLLNILEHVKGETTVINEAQRILRPGGNLILSVPCRGLFHSFKPHHARIQSNERAGPGDIRRYFSNDDLTRLLFLKFRVLRKHHGGLVLYPLTLAINNYLQRRFHSDGSRLLSILGDLDNDISWGSWSDHVIILAEKI